MAIPAADDRLHHTPERTPAGGLPSSGLAQIAAGVDSFPEGRDAAALGAAIAEATGAELLLITVHPDTLVVTPPELSWRSLRQQSEALLREVRHRYAPDARVMVRTGWSVPRELERVVRREDRELLVVGSSRHAAEGAVMIGKRARQLLEHVPCPLALAPRGLSKHSYRIREIAVAFDESPESEAALRFAGSLALSAGARLSLHSVVDDRLPPVVWTGLGGALMLEDWDAVIDHKCQQTRARLVHTAQAAVPRADVEVTRGRPSERLLALSAEVDLLVIGSRRWGAVARVVLGSTGEAVMHGARCPVAVVPRPPR